MTKEEQQEIIKLGEQMVEFAKFTIKVLNDVVLANKGYVDLILSDMFTHKTYNMGLVDANGKTNFYDGKVRVTAPDGSKHAEYEPKDYLEYVAEHVEPYSYLKYPLPEKGGLEGLCRRHGFGRIQSDTVVAVQCCRRNGDATAQAEYERMYETPDRRSHR